jgi:hypothetical protein
MPLDQITEKRVRDMAEAKGMDPDEAVSQAESRMAAKAPAPKPEADAEPAPGGKYPTFERLLIGAFPFIKVRELRQNWLGLTERVEDDEMFCGDFAAKHGGAASAPATPEAE